MKLKTHLEDYQSNALVALEEYGATIELRLVKDFHSCAVAIKDMPGITEKLDDQLAFLDTTIKKCFDALTVHSEVTLKDFSDDDFIKLHTAIAAFSIGAEISLYEDMLRLKGACITHHKNGRIDFSLGRISYSVADINRNTPRTEYLHELTYMVNILYHAPAPLQKPLRHVCPHEYIYAPEVYVTELYAAFMLLSSSSLKLFSTDSIEAKATLQRVLAIISTWVITKYQPSCDADTVAAIGMFEAHWVNIPDLATDLFMLGREYDKLTRLVDVGGSSFVIDIDELSALKLIIITLQSAYEGVAVAHLGTDYKAALDV